jgi:hypothetical protein
MQSDFVEERLVSDQTGYRVIIMARLSLPGHSKAATN